MPIAKSQRLRIPNHYYVYCDPPDKSGDEVLHFVSPQRRIKLKGHSFREFVQHVVPMLDGRHSFEELHAEVSDLFEAKDLEECFDFLAGQGVLEDAGAWGIDETEQERLRPQLNLFHDASQQPWDLQNRLAQSRVTLFGLTGWGVAAARALASAGVGFLRCVDAEPVAAADLYFNAEFGAADAGRPRVDALGPHLKCKYEGDPSMPADDAAVERAISGTQFIVNCLDEGNLSLMYRLNRVAMRTRTPWISAAASGFEAVVGPAVYPGETACYMCYRMRLLACAENPETGYDFESYLDRRKRDDSGHRANLAMGAGVAGQIVAAEVLKAITGLSAPATRGRVQVFDLRDLSSTMHIVLRKPWCPACAVAQDKDGVA
jgi:adenylyltransferase/sulfurtransferase